MKTRRVWARDGLKDHHATQTEEWQRAAKLHANRQVDWAISILIMNLMKL